MFAKPLVVSEMLTHIASNSPSNTSSNSERLTHASNSGVNRAGDSGNHGKLPRKPHRGRGVEVDVVGSAGGAQEGSGVVASSVAVDRNQVGGVASAVRASKESYNAYQRGLMQAYRAIKSGKASAWPR